jgi:GNAT superfamily N-acetyltransferase
VSDESGFEVRELSPEETDLAFEAMRALRRHLEDVDEFVDRVNRLQRPEGYRLVAALPAGGGEAAAVAGFRLMNNLVSGLQLYVDDLSTLPDARRRGLAGRLMTWLGEEAERAGCSSLELDSAVGSERTDAHRLYFNQGLAIAAFHFERAV